MAARLSGSGLDRAAACPASHALPSVRLPSSDAAERGTAIHKFLETGVIVDGKYDDDCKAIDYSAAVPIASVEYREITFAWDPVTGEATLVGTGLERDYSAAPPGTIPITLDRVWRDFQDNWHVDDYKTGRDAPSVDTLQLGLGAVCVERTLAHGQSIHVAIVHIDESGDVRRYAREYDALDLDVLEDRLRQVNRRVTHARLAVNGGAVPDVSVGPHCRYCPAMAACPAHAGLARKLLNGSDIAEQIATLPIEQVGVAWEQLQRAEAMLASIKAAIVARVDQAGEVPTPSGKTLYMQETVRRSVKVDRARDVFASHGIAPDVKESVTLTAIKAACRDAKHYAAVVYDLDEAGAMAKTETRGLREKARKEAST